MLAILTAPSLHHDKSAFYYMSSVMNINVILYNPVIDPEESVLLGEDFYMDIIEPARKIQTQQNLH
jgi:hypothetical protein